MQNMLPNIFIVSTLTLSSVHFSSSITLYKGSAEPVHSRPRSSPGEWQLNTSIYTGIAWGRMNDRRHSFTRSSRTREYTDLFTLSCTHTVHVRPKKCKTPLKAQKYVG